MADEDADYVRWLVEEVIPYKRAVRAYLIGNFPSLPDADNLVEESLVRVLQVRKRLRIDSPKALLFATARNLARDGVRRQRVVAFEPMPDAHSSEAFTDGTDVAALVCKKEESDLLAEAIQSLPERCRQVVMLRVANGFSQKKIAVELAISENTVEKQLANGIRRCSEFFARRGLV
jgi:RNA polymerase sigma-70 factor (ECF subfamily)